MCGICGVYAPQQEIAPHVVEQMNQSLMHRGPDGAGYFYESGIALAMRRLSVVDVVGSDQPLYNEDKSIALVFNGEIFNFRQLRNDLTQRGHTFHTQGDGETIAHLYEEYGTDAPKYLRGQFAFALWDNHKKCLFLARDIVGEKPLYYYFQDGVFIWASEIKAILQHPQVKAESVFHDPAYLAEYLTYGYIPAPRTAFKHIHALPPAHSLIVENGQVQIMRYWQPPTSAPSQSNADVNLYVGELRRLIDDAVQKTMIADVPLGAFLSGGLDSSLIVALMQQHATQPVKTFSIGFEGDASFDETSYAKQVAHFLKTEHTEFKVSPNMMEWLPKLVYHHDQPFGDSSALPTFLVSQLTRQHVTVALTGDGGDELFAGYERFYATALVARLGVVPKGIWRTMSAVIDPLPEGTSYYNVVKRVGRFVKGASLPLGSAYLDWMRYFTPAQIQGLTGYAQPFNTDFDQRIRRVEDVLSVNLTTYLPDDLLVKTDRMTMMASLEGRAPFLLQDVIEFAFGIPFNLKLRGNTTKYILKEMARGLLPDAIIDRPKHGFGVPIGAWLRKDSQLVREMLTSHEARLRDVLDTRVIAHMLDEHTQGKRDHAKRLWALLTLESWHRQFIK